MSRRTMYNGTEWISLSVTTTNKQINSSGSCWRLLAPGVGTVVAVRIGGVAVAVAVAVAGVTVVGDGVALGHGVKALGDGVQTGGGAEGDGGGIRVGTIGGIRISTIGIGSRVVTTIGVRVAVAIVRISISLRSSLGIGGPLAQVVAVGGDGNALGHGVQSLSDGVQTGGGAEGNGGGIGVGAVGSCVGVAEVLGLGTSHQTGLKIQNR